MGLAALEDIETMNDHATHQTATARHKAIADVLTLATRRADVVRHRDDANATANGYDAARDKAIRDIAAADRDPSADRSKLPTPEAIAMMAVHAGSARAESTRLTREIAAIPNIGRVVRRSFTRRLAPAKVRPVYPLPEPVVVERKPTWGARENARRVRQMARGAVLST